MSKQLFTKELGGTLLIVTPDNRTFEVHRGSGDTIHVTPDKGDECTSEEYKENHYSIDKHIINNKQYL